MNRITNKMKVRKQKSSMLIKKIKKVIQRGTQKLKKDRIKMLKFTNQLYCLSNTKSQSLPC